MWTLIFSYLVLVVDLKPKEQWYFFSDYQVPTYCSSYDNKFMTALHKSFEYECSENPRKKRCRKLFRKTAYYSRMRSKWCYR